MSGQFEIPRLMIAGTASGVGKTTVAASLAYAFRKRGLRVATFKTGPDYLDPSFHHLASERPCHNLDTWMMSRAAILHSVRRATQDADIALVEGMMGLFDGLAPDSELASSAHLAKCLGLPILLVTDASAVARTIAAQALGFARFDSDLQFAGMFANFIGGEAHLNLLKRSGSVLPILGGFPKFSEHSYLQRHLGLVAAHQASQQKRQITYWGEEIAKWLDLDQLLELASQASPLTLPAVNQHQKGAPHLCRIGIAYDRAFHFYYEENKRLLELAGAELVPFSPLHDATLPDVDGLWLGGGYPECYAKELAANTSMHRALGIFAEQNMPIYAECGGFMYLTQSLELNCGSTFPMVGLIPGSVRMNQHLQALGYVAVETTDHTILGPVGTTFRGHQFRYSNFQPKAGEPVDSVYKVQTPGGETLSAFGYSHKGILGSYIHGHWSSRPQIARNFVNACLSAKKDLANG